MTSKLGGRPTKDSSISDNFNQSKLGISNKDMKKAKRLARVANLRVKQVKSKATEILDNAAKEATEEIERVKREVGIKTEKPKEEEETVREEVPLDPDEDEKSAYEMLQHLRYAYRNAKGSSGRKGKQRLLELMEDDREFKYMVKELLKIEATLMSAKIRKGEDAGGVGQQNFFVVLKGLEDEKKFAVSDKTIDLKQIEHSLNPTGDTSYQPEEEEERNAMPEQLQKSSNVEEW